VCDSFDFNQVRDLFISAAQLTQGEIDADVQVIIFYVLFNHGISIAFFLLSNRLNIFVSDLIGHVWHPLISDIFQVFE